MVKVDLIVCSDVIITMDVHRRIIQRGALAILDGIIVAVDEEAVIQSHYTASEQLNVGTDVLLPGFINGHSHSPMTLLRGCSDDAQLMSWLRDTIFPLEKAFINNEFTYWGTMLALLEMMRGGITTVVDMYWHVDGIARACHAMGMRAIIGSTLLHHDHELDNAERFAKNWKDCDLITPALAPHSTAEVPLELLKQAFRAADTDGIPLLIHVDETKEGAQKVRERYGMSSIALLSHHGLLNARCIFAHAVHTTHEDLQKIAAAGAGIVHCPTSNMKLASGIAPVIDMLEEGCFVGLGTDGAASNNSLNIMAEIKLAVLLQRVHAGRADCLSAMTALECATIRGAQAIHKDHEIGSLEVGKKADVISIDLRQDHQLPAYHPVSTIVFASEPSDVRTVIINGVVKLQDGIIKVPEDTLREIRKEVMGFRAKISQAAS